MNDAAPVSGYAEAYAAWRADPQAWWACAAEGIAWERRWDSVFDPATRRPTASGSPAGCSTPATTAWTATSLAGRGEQAALIWDSPMTGRIETLHLSPDADAHRETRRRAGGSRRRPRRPRGDLHADGAGGGDRHAGLRAAGRHPFGGVRRFRRGRTGHPHRRRQAEGDRVGLLRAGAGPGGEIQAAARRGDRAVAAQAGRLPDPAARQAEAPN